MPTLLAVEDSATLRKVLEITFEGTDFQVTIVSSAAEALQAARATPPDVVVADGALAPSGGYDLCTQVKAVYPAARVLLLSSKQNPYDAAKGAAARIDAHLDKPFETQALIDQCRALLSGQASAPRAVVRPSGTVPLHAVATQAAPTVAAPTAAAATQTPAPRGDRASEQTRPVAASAIATPRPRGTYAQGPVATPVAAPVQVAPPVRTPARPAAVTMAAANVPSAAPKIAGDPAFAERLRHLGLTQAQVDGVLALSREVVERVVWEVVPPLAEVLIKEEIARLTK